MTQQEQQEFMENLEAALSWMRAIQERLKANDNTQGPRDALEARLRETEKIHQSEHEGRVKMDMVLVAAENLLQSGDEELRNHTHAKLKDLKSLWEETSTYIIHCHSRIEWVWLHWSEYLKAYEEFELWLTKQQRNLDVGVEHQVGVKEKQWQVDQQRVVVSDIHGQAALLERLLDEAAALHNRTQDPSVDPQAQERMQEAYNDVRDRAEEHLSVLQKIAEDHQMYQGCVQRFQSWLLSKTKELTDLMEREDTPEDKLKALQALDDSVACEEKTLQHIEGVAESVRANTSPAGAEVVVEEAEELRLGWQRLRQGLCEAEEGLRASLDSHSQYIARCLRLGEDISRLRLLLQGLDQELEHTHKSRDHTDHTEEQIVGQWRKYTGVRNTLAGEESQVELLKAQLKELFRFSEDSRHLSDDVLAVVKEHQSVKCRATRLCSESESGLRSILQDPLLVYAQWSHMVAQVLETSSGVTDFSHIAMLVQSIERLLKDSVQLQERFSLLQVKGDLLDSVFGLDRSDGLQGELSAAIRNRELLHAQLLQRKSRLQGLISRTKDFGNTYELIHSKLSSLRDRLAAADGLQPDILAKKSQSDQFRVIQKDLEDCEGHIVVLETLVSSSPSNRTQFEKLCGEWKHLHKAVRVKVNESEENITEHESFHESLLNIEKWLMIMKQKLESFHSPSGEWSIEGRQHEAERVLGEFPGKDLQLQQTEVQGQGVLERTSGEGQVHILRDIKRLKDSWLALYNMSLNLHSSIIPTGQLWWHRSSRRPKLGRRSIHAVQEGLSRDVVNNTSSIHHGIAVLCLLKYFHASMPDTNGSKGHNKSRRWEFESWLSQQNELLSGVLSSKEAALSAKEVKTRQDTLKALRTGVCFGQEQFQLLLQESQGSEDGSGPAEDVGLEELRYRWMLYKSKLKDEGELRARTSAKVRQVLSTDPALINVHTDRLSVKVASTILSIRPSNTFPHQFQQGTSLNRNITLTERHTQAAIL
uniref:Spectrin repeat containing, nuclear envelope family member 3 n=1 Tax=Amphiprion ocellaris TaxID=80972 RepID=A0A3Q1BMY1_AMPOC